MYRAELIQELSIYFDQFTKHLKVAKYIVGKYIVYTAKTFMSVIFFFSSGTEKVTK